MQPVTIHSVIDTPTRYTNSVPSGRMPFQEPLPDDQVTMRARPDSFVGLDPEQITWDATTMSNTLSMIRSGQGEGVHGHLNLGRINGFLRDAGIGMV